MVFGGMKYPKEGTMEPYDAEWLSDLYLLDLSMLLSFFFLFSVNLLLTFSLPFHFILLLLLSVFFFLISSSDILT
jgi:hypothetical protein